MRENTPKKQVRKYAPTDANYKQLLFPKKFGTNRYLKSYISIYIRVMTCISYSRDLSWLGLRLAPFSVRLNSGTPGPGWKVWPFLQTLSVAILNLQRCISDVSVAKKTCNQMISDVGSKKCLKFKKSARSVAFFLINENL